MFPIVLICVGKVYTMSLLKKLQILCAQAFSKKQPKAVNISSIENKIEHLNVMCAVLLQRVLEIDREQLKANAFTYKVMQTADDQFNNEPSPTIH